MPDPLIALPQPPRKRARPGEGWAYIENVALVYDGDECMVWPFGRSGGYGMVYVPDLRQNVLVHRVICEGSCGPAPTPEHEAAHSCGNGHQGCISPRHLSWKTPAENAADAIGHGKTNRGAAAHFAKLSGAEVIEIRALGGHLSQRKIAAIYGVAQPAIGKILRRQNWAWVRD